MLFFLIFVINIQYMNDNKEAIFYNALNLACEANLNFLAKIKANFSSYQRAWQASEYDFSNLGIEEKTLKDFFEKKKKNDPEKAFAELEKFKIKLILSADDDYPTLLKEICFSPLGLYIKTNAEIKNLFSGFALAVVGTRRATIYGKDAAYKISQDLAKAGVTITSGLAWGIDAVAHQAACDANGITLAVLGSGLNEVYPPSNRKLAEEIIKKSGALISEYPLYAPALPFHFPQRNRIVSGLSKGVIVIEAPEKSGALITAGFALEQNREVFALPGPIFSKNSAGPNLLIQKGAKLITKAEDILIEFKEQFGKNLKLDYSSDEKIRIFDDKSEEKVFHFLEKEPSGTELEKIMENSGLDAKNVIAILSMLEIKGYIKNIGGRYRTI